MDSPPSPQRPLPWRPRGIDFSLDGWPPARATAVFALQWLVVLVPGLLVLGEVVARAQGLAAPARVAFLQRLLLACGLTQAVQVLWGHRLSGLVGPSAVLMVGVLATLGEGPAVIYPAMAAAGLLTALVGLLGLAHRLGRLYTPAVLASTLMLIAMTLAPTLRDLIFWPGSVGGGETSFLFALALILAMLWGQHFLTGLWSSAVVVMGMVLGTAVFHLAGLARVPLAAPQGTAGWGLPALLPQGLSFHPAVIAAFCLCYLAVVSNELATVEAVGEISGANDMRGRRNRAVAVLGLGGVLSGLLGVPGPVTYSVSPAVIISSRCASRWPLLVMVGGLLVLAAWPQALAWFYLVPPPVVAAVLFFLLANTVFASLRLLMGRGATPDWTEGVVVGSAMTAGLLVAFMPPEVKAQIHPMLRPLAANGFVVGLAVALVLDHLLLRRKS